MTNISIDKEKCIACGACSATCPITFEMREVDGEMKAVVKQQPSKITCEKEAAESCPVDAISIS